MRSFAGIDLSVETVPGATTEEAEGTSGGRWTGEPLLKFRHLLEKAKAQVRARVEHPFHIIKNLFRHCKTRHRGLAKNTSQLHSLFAQANLIIAKRPLLNIADA